MTKHAKHIFPRELPTAELLGGLHPILKRVYAAREIRNASELNYALEQLAPFSLLRGIDAAVDLLVDCVVNARRILVIGDFDADGATSCAVSVRALRALGAQHVDFLVPNRFEFGYGLTPEIVAIALPRAPDLIMTVDNGISSVEGVEAARAAGVKVLITDHHLPGSVLPNAQAVVNPNQAKDHFPSKNLAGVGVAFYVMLALRARLRAMNWFAPRGLPEPNLGRLLDIVALGTVADLVPLDQNNRILVAQGLQRIQQGRACAGINALLKVSGRTATSIRAADLGFVLGPRVNAAGRLADMSLGIECLLTDDEDAALAYAQQLDQLNCERRKIEAEMQGQAHSLIELWFKEHSRLTPGMECMPREDTTAGMPEVGQRREQLPRSPERPTVSAGICLYDPSWHQGVIGVLASRIKERFHRPTVIFAAHDNGCLKGSARSIAGLHIRDLLDRIATLHPGVIKTFGGHAMAAGLTIAADCLEAFQQYFVELIEVQMGASCWDEVVHTDGELAAEDMTLNTAELLESGGPWGQGFPEPSFEGHFRVCSRRVVGEKHLKLSLQTSAGLSPIDAIAFNSIATLGDTLEQDNWVQVVYRLSVNDYQGRRSPQMVIDYVQRS